MQNHNKKDMILDAMQELMGSANVRPFLSVILPKKPVSGKEVSITIFLPRTIS